MSSRPAQRFFVCLALSVCLACLAPARCAAWGSAGHRVIARVAARRLSNSAKKGVAKLLGVQPDDKAIAEAMAQVSTYADEIRVLRPDTAAWHFVDMPGSASTYVPARDCAETKRGDCAVAAVERFEKVLTDASASPEARAEALKFVIHLVGDLSQPLHCYGDDEGGNLVRVVLPNKKQTNLHSMWDTDLVETLLRQKPDEAAYANFLADGIESLEGENSNAAPQLHLTRDERLAEVRHGTIIARWAVLSPEQWATDSHGVARDKIYAPLPRQKTSTDGAAGRRVTTAEAKKMAAAVIARGAIQQQTQAPQQSASRPPVVLDPAYFKSSSEEAERQLIKAGLRLAAVLNAIYK
jgi:hypothetical protein